MWMILFLLLPLVGISYIAWHVWIMLPVAWYWKTAVIAVGVICFLLLFLDISGKLASYPLPVSRALYEIGTSSLIVLLYLILCFLLLDVGRWLHVVPREVLYSNWRSAVAVVAVMCAIFLYGNLNYRNKVRVPLTLKSEKPVKHGMKLLMASDLHLGYHNPRKELARWVDMINAEQPDYVLIAGDIIDISVHPLRVENMAAEFRRLNAPVYACLGNHEYYSGEPLAQQFYKDAGIHLLIDESVELDGGITIVGRDDRTNVRRKSLAQLMHGVDSSRYIILLDHQPYNLEEAEQAGVDFQLSGHTHRGQVWPISWITDAIYEKSWGSHRRGSTEYYVSSGLGIWGGKFRIGTQSEYVVATLQ